MAATVTSIDSFYLSYQSLSPQDAALINNASEIAYFTSSSYIEFSIFVAENNLLSTEYNFFDYTVLNNGQYAGNGNIITDI